MAMEHWAVTDKQTGERAFVMVDAGSHPSNHGYDAATHRFVRLDREPTQCDKFDGKKLRRCAETAARIERQSQLNRVTRADLLDRIERLEAIMRANGLMPEE
ncbi:hypothetical protein [Sphingomonas sp. G-3-2-10]|uniref:hypothetical protein n=1 Tax=Sphingomonas sp. G-3-2-10 TaxID=2728838 RepID=UPI00146CEC74|nr:hypothetical protein [Sphingomonas sp. G-3-2-10]NML04263.1 hypothetical protein [Sphingomonas sp. G-3-2-10]